MNTQELFRPLAEPMSDESFRKFSEYIHGYFGIKMPQVKKTMLESRLIKRLKNLGINSFEEYREYVFSQEGMKSELVHMIDAVTTNKTDFFREPEHFNYLVNEALPELLDSLSIGRSRPLSVWSAGCSSGEEPYTLAMVLTEFAGSVGNYRFNILGTDLSSRMLEAARMGIYKDHRIEPIPERLRKKYLMRSRDRSSGLVRVNPQLRSAVSYRRLNFMDDDFGFDEDFDIIFCRNVIIYFDKPTQGVLMKKLCDHLIPGGYLFVGHSETLNSFQLPLLQVAPMVYRKVDQ
jgi:chemotaxis protein methyltransferase CheR